MLLATSLVMLMTPGLAFFYGGLVGRKNVLAIMIQSFLSMGWTSVIWFTVGYSMCFSGDVGGIIGNLKMAFLHGVTPDAVLSPTNNIPLLVFIAYQMMFAIITPALITGAFTNRVRFAAYMVFLTVWLLFVYFPAVHMIWGGGLLQKWGVLDFAGGIVVHAIAGMAALAAVFFVGRRKVHEKGPHSIPLVALGTGLLWFGWYGFNAGSELRVDHITSLAFLNTDTAASFAAVTWLIMAWIFEKKPKFLGLLTGSIAGLATITPAAGYVTVPVSALIGIVGRGGLLRGDFLEEQDGLGRCPGCLGGPRRGRHAGHPAPGDLRHAQGQPQRSQRPVVRRDLVLLQTGRGRDRFRRLRFHLLLRRPVPHQQDHAGQDHRRGGEHGPGHGASRGRGVFPRMTPESSGWAPESWSGAQLRSL